MGKYGFTSLSCRLPAAMAVLAMAVLCHACYSQTPETSRSSPPQQVELSQILQVALELDDNALQEILFGVRQGIRGRKIELPAGWSQWMEQVKSRGSSGAWNQAILLGLALNDSASVKEAVRLLQADDVPVAQQSELGLELAAQQIPEVVEVLVQMLDRTEVARDAVRALARYDKAEVADELLSRLVKWDWKIRNEALQVLVSRPDSAIKLCRWIESPESKFPAKEVSASMVRQMRALDEPEVDFLVRRIWGEVRSTPWEQQKKIRRFQDYLVANTLNQADIERGRGLATKLCLTCHRLNGAGQVIGPDLTGSQRGDLYYLLHNVVDPSAEIDASMRLTILETKDGRNYSGIVSRESDQSIDLQTATELLTLAKSKIERRQFSTESMMPAGILDSLQQEEVRDLIGFLMHDKRVREEQK